MKPPYELVQEFWKDKLMTMETKQELMKVVEGIVWFTMERCAKVCETVSLNWSANNDEYKSVALMCAEEIRKQVPDDKRG